jgi:hypothetical protein
VPIPTAEQQPTVPLWPTAAEAIGIKSRATAYRAAHADQLPFRTLQAGVRLVVPTVELRRALGLDSNGTVEHEQTAAG